VVLNHQENRNSHRPRVVQYVALVFDVLDDRDQDAGVTLPEEDAINVGRRIARNEVLDLAIVVGEHNDGDVESGAADFTGQLRGAHVADCEVGDDQIELRVGTREIERFGAAGNVGDSRNLLQVEFERFVDQEFVEASVFAEDEGVVETRDQKNVVDLEGHQVFEAFKALFSVEDGGVDA